jgi:hypothetical protein
LVRLLCVTLSMIRASLGWVHEQHVASAVLYFSFCHLQERSIFLPATFGCFFDWISVANLRKRIYKQHRSNFSLIYIWSVVTQVLCNISPTGVLWDKICIQARARLLCNCALYHAFLLPGIVFGTSWKCAIKSHWPVMDYLQKQLESWVYAGQVILECSVALLPMLYGDLEVQDLYAICCSALCVQDQNLTLNLGLKLDPFVNLQWGRSCNKSA